jgi:nucleoside-diphosphate-sugar epimerase
MKRALVTGGCGFVGRRFVRRLVDNGWDVTVVDDMSTGQLPADWAFPPSEGPYSFYCAKEDVRTSFRVLCAAQYGLIIHCAAVVGGRQNIDGDPLGVAQNLAIDSDFFRWLARTGRKDQKVVYFSSSAVYPVDLQQEQSHCRLSEGLVDLNRTRIGMPDQTYGWSKLSGERLAKVAVETHGLDVVIYRPFGGYGEDQDLTYPFPSIVKRVMDGESPVTVWGSGNQERDFIHIEDVVTVVLDTMNKLKPGEALNIGTGKALSFLQLARWACMALEHPPKVANDASKPQGVFSRVADTHRLEALLPGWRPSIDVDRGIGLVADFLRARRQAGGNHLTRAAE